MRGLVPLSILTLTLVAACSSSSSDDGALTAIRIHATLDPSVKVTQLQFQNGGNASTVPEAAAGLLGESETVTILLDDASVGTALHVDVWGLAEGARVAHGDVRATPELHRTIDVSTMLAPSSSCPSGGCAPCAWTLATVDSTGDMGPSTWIEADRAGGVHVSYWDRGRGALKYAYRASASGDWTRTTVDTRSAGRNSSLALDAAGGVHIAYSVDESTRLLRIADRPSASSSWTTEDIESIGTSGPYPSIAVGPSGATWVSYLQGSDLPGERISLKYGQRTSGGASWNLQALDEPNNVGSSTALAVDAAGNVALGYFDVPNHDLKYVELSDLATKVTVDAVGNVGQGASLAFDASGGAHLSYYDNTNLVLKYAYRPKIGEWVTTTVDSSGDVGKFTSLAVDGAGDPHIAYYDVTHKALKYAHHTGSSWSTTTLDTPAEPGGISLALDGAGGVHVSYAGEKSPASELKYAYLCK